MRGGIFQLVHGMLLNHPCQSYTELVNCGLDQFATDLTASIWIIPYAQQLLSRSFPIYPRISPPLMLNFDYLSWKLPLMSK